MKRVGWSFTAAPPPPSQATWESKCSVSQSDTIEWFSDYKIGQVLLCDIMNNSSKCWFETIIVGDGCDILFPTVWTSNQCLLLHVLPPQSDAPRPVCSQDPDVAGVWESRLGASEVTATSVLLEWSRDDIVPSMPMYFVEFRQRFSQLFDRAHQVCKPPLNTHTCFLYLLNLFRSAFYMRLDIPPHCNLPSSSDKGVLFRSWQNNQQF